MSRLLAILALTLSSLSVPLAAQQHPNAARGFSAAGSFNAGDVDSVNLFNGNLVIRLPLGQSFHVNGALSYGLTLVYNNSVWDHQLSGGETNAIPNRTANAGLGWMVSLGRLNPPTSTEIDSTRTTYLSPDGAVHSFYPALHEGDAAVAGVQYTRDGTYLRFRQASNEIDFPEGTIHHFDAAGNPDAIRDRFGNQITIAYSTNLWTISDGHRTQRVFFRGDLSADPVVSKIEIAGFGGSTATWSFLYSNDEGSAVQLTGCSGSSAAPDVWPVPLLTQVTLPDGSFYRMAVSDYSTQSSVPCQSGMLKGMTLPTLGRIEWDYMEYAFPPASSNRLFLQKTTGVAKRRLKDAAGGLLGEWTYSTALTADARYAHPQELVNTLVTPLGDKSVHYFSVSTLASDSQVFGWNAFEYGLPLSRYVTDGGLRYLSSQVFDCDPGAVNCQLKRTSFLAYEFDPGPWSITLQENSRKNQRARATRTNYDDNGLFEATASSSFDGLGHYRQTDLSGNFGAGDSRSSFVNFNPGQSFPGTFTPPAASAPWVLNTFTDATVSEGGVSARTEHCFDPNTGFLLRTRTLASGTSRSANDVVMRYTPDSTGNVAAEESFGGDGGGLDTTASLCNLVLPASQVRIDSTYQFGSLKTAQYAGTPFLSVNRDIDQNTGLTSRSRDTAGLFTAFEYDALGRLLWIKPQQDAWTRFLYTPASSSFSLAETHTSRVPNGGGGILAESKTFYDALGRVIQEQQRMPDFSWSARATTYNAMGWRNTVSEMGAVAKTTSFLNYDPFGRPAIVRPPDGSTHDVTFSYSGTRTVSRTVKVATGGGSESAATTSVTYDRQGRLVQVTEPNGVATTYDYDVGGRLKRVCQGASGGTCGQERLFTYDDRGFLLSEKHPEKGASGNGTVSYSEYDSRGHAHRTIDGPNDLTYFYDQAERVFKIVDGANRTLKLFAYSPTNGFNDFSQGKLQKATRFNYVPLGTSTFKVQVDETYTYGGLGGRVSQRDTASTTNDAPGESFTQGFSYNELGQVSSLTYPLCTHPGCTQPVIFDDVPAGHPDRAEIEAIFPGVTSGCGTNPLMYCPTASTTRAEMALFLLRGKEGPSYTPPPCTTPMFADVPCSSGFAPWINELARRGITSGCGGGNFCPANQVSNNEMSVFLLTTLLPGFVPPDCTTPPFFDVPCSNPFAKWIAEEARRGIMPGCGSGNFCPASQTTRAQMAGMIARAFDIPVPRDPHTSRTAQFTYTQGLLTAVAANSTVYGTLSYHPNLLVSQIAHGNGMSETQSNDPNGMRRPAALVASGPFAVWSTGTYSYDGAGNVKAIGSATFTYDALSRLTFSSQFDGITGGGNLKQQSYTFDNFGNLTSITTNGALRNTPTSATTNRLTGGGTGIVGYDAAGNLTSWNGAAYQFDAFNQMNRMTSGGEDLAYAYTADDERIWSYDINRNASRWTLRDLGGMVLREYRNDQNRWSLATDYIYRDGLLLAADTLTGRRHFHLDHLGTPRLITRASGYPAAYHLYYPFGEEATAFNQDAERMKFTGHERDLASLAGAGDDLDYMHARLFNPLVGRFTSVDLITGSPRVPQNWNRYTYVGGNPFKYVDPDGLERQAFFLVTGKYFDPIRHSAIFIRDDDSGKETDVVFSHGGQASGVQTLASYLAAYDPRANPTTAYRLKLNPQEVGRLFDSLKSEWNPNKSGTYLSYVGVPYDDFTNNCTQFACEHVIEAKQSWDPIRRIFAETIDVFGAPVVMTNDTIRLLSDLGLLGSVEKGLKAPSNAPKNVIIYWSYTPPK